MSYESGIPVQRIRNVYSSTNVTTGAWVELDSALNQSCNVIEIFDSSGNTMELGIGPAGSESSIPMYIVPGGNGRIRYRLDKGARLAVKAVNATSNSGELVLNLYY